MIDDATIKKKAEKDLKTIGDLAPATWKIESNTFHKETYCIVARADGGESVWTVADGMCDSEAKFFMAAKRHLKWWIRRALAARAQIPRYEKIIDVLYAAVRDQEKELITLRAFVRDVVANADVPASVRSEAKELQSYGLIKLDD